MTEYRALARTYRPTRFGEVLGQEAIVTTLKNALTHERLAHAYLFSGPRGTGKTTLARLLAKAINCSARNSEGEPCGSCSSCHEIDGGGAMDVIEIDGASHRGIDDMRQINETVGYAASDGHTKIYIVDEVHMLTKEAFNALLKTLEEPPRRVKFFFATTEPHRVPATILSRCQRFQLQRLTPELIIAKLQREAQELNIAVDEPSLRLIAHAAEGGMRDAESIFDQVISFHGSEIDEKSVADLLGLVPRDTFFRLDEAGKSQDLAAAFTITAEVLQSGRDLSHFLSGLTDHIRTLLLCKLNAAPTLPDAQRYATSAAQYDRHQLLDLLDDLLAAHQTLRQTPSKRTFLETLLTRVIRTPRRIPIEQLVTRLAALEGKPDPKPEAPPQQPPDKRAPGPSGPRKEPPKKEAPPAPVPRKPPQAPPERKSHYDTVLRFAAVELEGRAERNG